MSWFICGRVPPVNRHETGCSSAISHVVVAIGGTLVRLRGRVMAGRVREGGGCAGKLNRVLLKQWVCVLILSSVLIDRSLGLSDDTLMLYSRASLRRRTETNIYGNTWLPNGSWSLSQLFAIWSEHRTQINCAAKVARVRMHSSQMSLRLNHWPSLVHTRKNNSIAGQTTWEILIETFIETWLACYWDFIEESRLSCMSTISLDHTHDTIFTA